MVLNKTKIDYLTNCQEHLEELAKWRAETWGKYNHSLTYEYCVNSFKEHCNYDKLPLTYVCRIESRPIGMVSLRKKELPQYTCLEPWIGGLYVDKEHREHGIGSWLVRHIEEKARCLDYQFLHLFIFDLNLLRWYEDLGYIILERTSFVGYPIIIMRKSLWEYDKSNTTLIT